jgi:hypothetical protein
MVIEPAEAALVSEARVALRDPGAATPLASTSSS